MLVESREEAKKTQLSLLQSGRTQQSTSTPSAANVASVDATAAAHSAQSPTTSIPTLPSTLAGTAPSNSAVSSPATGVINNGSVGTGAPSPKVSTFQNANGIAQQAQPVNAGYGVLPPNATGMMQSATGPGVRLQQHFRFQQMNNNLPINNPAALHLLYQQQQQALQRRHTMNNSGASSSNLASQPPNTQ
ncbi:hypothetical protein HDU96_003353 [Phlyctochytrium bullatum]|nr:hypothetical protein HDU96_003353 [Phlyctochytrium bullatum]